jgi:hypothetical protein
MKITLDDILALVGPIDDARGFDTPRERFRRFLLDHVPDAAAARSLIEECQRASDEQHRRVLQDAVVLTGRFLGFETSFGSYRRAPGTARADGFWKSSKGVGIVVKALTDQTQSDERDEFVLASNSLSLPHVDSDIRQLALCVVTAPSGGASFEDPLSVQRTPPDLRVVSINSLLWLADAVCTGRLSHRDVVHLVQSDVGLDLIVNLMRQCAGDRRRQSRAAAIQAAPPAESPVTTKNPAFWMVSLHQDGGATPEQLLDAVIRKRRILGVNETAGEGRAQAGDWICFAVRGKGIVGHAQVEAIVEGANLIREAHRFRLVCRLKGVALYEEPVPVAPETAGIAAYGLEGAGSRLMPVSRDTFKKLGYIC